MKGKAIMRMKTKRRLRRGTATIFLIAIAVLIGIAVYGQVVN